MKKIFTLCLLVFISTTTINAQNTLDLMGLSASNPSPAAFSLRKLSSSYAGSAIQVRRSNDNATQDIGFIGNGDLDTASLKTFVGSNNGFVTIWYDQSGNARNATQSTNGSQPQIVSDGSVNRKNGIPTISFSNQKLATAGFVGFPSAFSLAIIGGVSNNVGYQSFGGKTLNNYAQPWDIYSNNFYVGDGGAGSGGPVSLTKGLTAATGFSQWSFTGNSSTKASYINGAANGSGSVSYYGDGGAALILASRADAATQLNGWISEYVTLSSVLNTTDRQTVENSQLAYYNFTNANLSAINISNGTLSPSFTANTTAYTASVANAINSITVTPTVEVSGATVQVSVNGGSYVTVASGSASSALSLNVGNNPINMRVTALDGTTLKTYTITVTRAASSNADLSALTLSAGTLSPTFASGTTSYTASVTNSTSSVTITPTRSQANATIQARVNGGSYASVTSGSASGSLSLNVGSNTIDVLVTAEDGTTTKTYTITVCRTATPLISLSTASTTICTGSSVTVTATPTNGGVSPTYNFKVNGSSVQNSITATYTSNSFANGDVITCDMSVSYSCATSSTVSSGNNITLTILANGTWTGTVDNNTATAGNWCGGIPASNADIVIAATANNPTLTGNLTVNNLTLNDTLVLGGYKLTVNGAISGTNTVLTGSNASAIEYAGSGSSTLTFDQTTNGNILNPTTGTNSLKDLIVSGSGALTLGNKVNLFERLSVSAGTLNTGDSLVLRSIAGTSGNNTAYVDQVGGTINGQARVERYVHKQYRGWRAITSPVTYNGISQGYVSTGWQNSWGFSGNYGTRITGPSATNGIDDVSFSGSLKTYNSSTGAWNEITNTTTETLAGNSGSADNKAFFMFVRGDRTVTPNGYNPNSFVPTTLAARGKLQTGNQVFTFTGAANKAWLIGNPYACPVDMSAVTFGGSVPNFVYVWDPNLSSSYSDVTGNYVTFDRTAWGAGAPGSSITQYFQSGQCFFIAPTTTSASVTFHEGDKNPTQNNQTAGVGNGLSDMFNVKLSSIKTDGSRSTIDGIRAKFGSSYSAVVDADDAYKWSSTGLENMSLKRGTSLLTIEARPYITTTDSLFINVANLSVGSNYEFQVNPVNFDASVSSCKLVDRFLNTETPISLNSTTLVGFNVTSVTGSNAANRFFVVFNATGNLPTSNSLTVKAYKQNNNIKIDWEAIAENNIKMYTVEKSTDALSFTKLTEATAKNGNSTNAYSFTDNNPVIGVNYYRIQSIQTNNNKVYSTIVRVEMSDKGIKSITVYPNPVKSNSNVIGLQVSNLTADVYTARLYNVAGQQVWMNTINHNGNNGSTNLQLNKTLAAGSYQLQLTDTKGNNYQQTVLVVE